MTWLKVNLTWLTRSITAVLGVPLDFALDLLAKNFKIGTGAEAIDPAAPVLGRRRARRPSSPATRSAAGGSALLAGGLLPLHRAVRPMDERDADARR